MAFASFSWPFRRRSRSGDGPSKTRRPLRRRGGGGGGARRDAAAPRLPADALPRRLQVFRPPDQPRHSSSTLGSASPLGPSQFLTAGGSAEEAADGELSDWQQRHAVLVLARAKELAKIRYDLCPRHMKDKQFWSLYFLLARGYILPYELRAIQKEKEVQQMGKQGLELLSSPLRKRLGSSSCNDYTGAKESEHQDHVCRFGRSQVLKRFAA